MRTIDSRHRSERRGHDVHGGEVKHLDKGMQGIANAFCIRKRNAVRAASAAIPAAKKLRLPCAQGALPLAMYRENDEDDAGPAMRRDVAGAGAAATAPATAANAVTRSDDTSSLQVALASQLSSASALLRDGFITADEHAAMRKAMLDRFVNE